MSMGQSGGKKSKIKHPNNATQPPTPPWSAQGRLGEEFVFVPLDRSQTPPVWQESLKILPPVLSVSLCTSLDLRQQSDHTDSSM